MVWRIFHLKEVSNYSQQYISILLLEEGTSVTAVVLRDVGTVSSSYIHCHRCTRRRPRIAITKVVEPFPSLSFDSEDRQVAYYVREKVTIDEPWWTSHGKAHGGLKYHFRYALSVITVQIIWLFGKTWRILAKKTFISFLLQHEYFYSLVRDT